MHELLYIIGGIIVLAIVLLFYQARSFEDDLLKGFWLAPPEFCHEAGVDKFMLYLSDNMSYTGNRRKGHMLMFGDGQLLIDSQITINLGTYVTFKPSIVHDKKYKAHIDWDDTEHDEEDFPSDINVVYYPRHGKLVFYEDDTVYAIFYKDAVLSSMHAQDTMPKEVLGDSSETEDSSDSGDSSETSDTEDSGNPVDNQTHQYLEPDADADT